MPDVDLKPGDYRVQTKGGRWLSRESTPLLVYGGTACALILGYAWWHKSEVPLMMLVGTAAGCGLAFGLILGAWLKRFD